MNMGCKQVNIFGDYKIIVEKNNKTIHPRKTEPQTTKLKQKIALLYNLYKKLYEKQNISILEQREVIVKENLIIYPGDMQAEPKESIKMHLIDDIDKKIEIAQNELNKYEQMQLDFTKGFNNDIT